MRGRSDLTDAGVWMALGLAVTVASVRMDRLEDQDINPYTIPGLLPGLLGAVLLMLGALLAMRSLRRPAAAADAPALGLRTALVIGLCVVFDTVLVGHGLPFWAASALFVTVSILALGRRERAFSGLEAGKAAAIGLGAGAAITAVFQWLFLVRLP